MTRSRLLAALAAAVLALAMLAAGGAARPLLAQTAGDGAEPSAPPRTVGQASDSAAKRNLFAKRDTPPATVASVPFAAFSTWLMATQQKVHRALAEAVKDLKTGSPLWAALVLGGLSFAYGVLHAAGPGHGKAVISSYVLANERTVKRGIMLSFLAAGIQGLSALVIVGIMVLALRATSLEIKATEGWIETISWALVILIGIWLLYGQLKALVAGWGAAAEPVGAHVHGHDGRGHAQSHHDHHAHGGGDHDHHNHHHDGCCGHHHDHGTHGPGHAHSHSHAHTDAIGHGDDHGQMHDHAACCGHAHMPAADELQGPLSWSKALAIAFAVGIRPCTGAILVLVFAISQGLAWAGVFATFAMALGTAITVSALAALAVGSRDLAKRFAGADSRWGWRIERTAGIGGALLVIGLGAMLFAGSLGPQAPF